MRRVLPVLLAAGLLLTVTVLPAVAATSRFRAVVQENFERRASAELCTFDEPTETFTCFGTATVQGYGRATSAVEFHEGTVTRTLTFADGSTLTLSELWGTDESHIPGNVFNAPGQMVSFGNPFFDFGTWTVIGGTGMFEGATGSGVSENVQAGDTIVLRFDGELSL